MERYYIVSFIIKKTFANLYLTYSYVTSGGDSRAAGTTMEQLDGAHMYCTLASLIALTERSIADKSQYRIR